MKIVVISGDEKNAIDIAKALRALNSSDDVSVSAVMPSSRAAGEDPAAPDLLILDATYPECPYIDQAESLSHLCPRMSFIALSRDLSPEFLMKAMRAGVREVIPLPLNIDSLHAAIQRVEAKRSGQPHDDGRVLAFVSCKGGSGATFLATNLGYALSTLKKSVALVDLNLQFGDASLFVTEQKPQATIADVAQQIHRLDSSFLAASMIEVAPSYGVLAAPEDPAQAADVQTAHVEKIIKLMRKHYDFVLLDIGRSLDPVSVNALDQADIIFPVLQTTLPYIRDGKRQLTIFQSLGYSRDKIQMVVNRHEKNGDIKLEDVEAALGVKKLRTIPNNYEAAAASVNQGVPVLKLFKSSPVSRALLEFAQSLLGEPAQTTSGWLRRVLQRG